MYRWSDRGGQRDDGTEASSPVPHTANGTNGVPTATSDTAYGRRALERETTIVASTEKGSRNDALNRAWFRMGRLVPHHLAEQTVRGALAEAGRACGLPQSEVDLVLRDDATSGVAQGQAAPREARPLDPVPEPAVLPEGDDASEQDVSAIIREKFPLIDWRELWDTEDDEEWIVEPLLPARRLVALFSAPKVGKSLVMLEVAVAIARGTEVLGVTPDRPRRVLYVDFENDPRGDVRERLQAMGREPGDLADLCYLSFPSMAHLDTVVGGRELMAAVSVYECEVVVIDTVSRAIAGEENDNDTWLAFYRNTGLAMKQAGVSCIRLDHTGKDADKGMRGGSAKYGDVDLVWQLSRISETSFQLRCTDHRLPVPTDEVVLERVEHPYLLHRLEGSGWTATRDAKIAEVVRTLDDAELPKQTGRRQARGALREANIAAKNNVIDAALRERKQRPTMLGEVDE